MLKCYIGRTQKLNQMGHSATTAQIGSINTDNWPAVSG